MHPMLNISLVGSLMIFCSPAHAQQAMNFDDDFTSDFASDFVFPSPLLDRPASLEASPLENTYSTLLHFSSLELNAFRVAGVDPSWITGQFDLPSAFPNFNPQFHRRATQGDHPLMIESWATHYTSARGVPLNDSVRFSVGRTTELRDGNISGNAGILNTGAANEHISSLTQSEGEYDVYDLSLEWEAINAGPVTLSVLSGLKAIEANIGKSVTKGNDTTIERVNRVAAVPMIGSGLRWQISESFSFSGAALTHPTQAGDALIDFNASTDLRLSTNVMFSAGYRILRSSFEVGAVETDIDQKGLFARIEIRF